MDWNMRYSNVTKPTWEQVTEYIGNPLWTDFNKHMQWLTRSGPAWNIVAVPCRQVGMLSIRRTESLFVRSIRWKAILLPWWL